MTVDNTGLELRYDYLEQFDHYEDDQMKKMSRLYSGKIGKVIISFNELESVLESCISFLINNRTDSLGMQVIEYLDFSEKISLGIKLIASNIGIMGEVEYKVPLQTLRKEFVRLSEIRNLVAHAKWASLDKKSFVRTTLKVETSTGDVKFKAYKITPDILIKINKDINRLRDDFETFLEALDL